jgi:hypothetical protein
MLIHILFYLAAYSYHSFELFEISCTSLLCKSFIVELLTFGRDMMPCILYYFVSTLGFMHLRPSHSVEIVFMFRQDSVNGQDEVQFHVSELEGMTHKPSIHPNAQNTRPDLQHCSD